MWCTFSLPLGVFSEALLLGFIYVNNRLPEENRLQRTRFNEILHGHLGVRFAAEGAEAGAGVDRAPEARGPLPMHPEQQQSLSPAQSDNRVSQYLDPTRPISSSQTQSSAGQTPFYTPQPSRAIDLHRFSILRDQDPSTPSHHENSCDPYAFPEQQQQRQESATNYLPQNTQPPPQNFGYLLPQSSIGGVGEWRSVHDDS